MQLFSQQSSRTISLYSYEWQYDFGRSRVGPKCEANSNSMVRRSKAINIRGSRLLFCLQEKHICYCVKHSRTRHNRPVHTSLVGFYPIWDPVLERDHPHSDGLAVAVSLRRRNIWLHLAQAVFELACREPNRMVEQSSNKWQYDQRKNGPRPIRRGPLVVRRSPPGSLVFQFGDGLAQSAFLDRRLLLDPAGHESGGADLVDATPDISQLDFSCSQRPKPQASCWLKA